jgi:predicted nucleic acid-binding protein
LLLDTGALVSLLDRSQHRHVAFMEYFERWSGEVVTTEAVLTEAIRTGT